MAPGPQNRTRGARRWVRVLRLAATPAEAIKLACALPNPFELTPRTRTARVANLIRPALPLAAP